MTNMATRTYETLADFAPDWVAIPGATIADLLEERGMTQVDLANRTGLSAKHINQLLKGKATISEETALKLEQVLGSTARFWLNLESQYREHLARRGEIASLAKQVHWLRELPLADLCRFGWVRKCDDKAQQVFECLRFFGVGAVDAWRREYEQPAAAYRAPTKLIRNPAAVSSWLRYGERAAQDMRLSEFRREAFMAALHNIRTLTLESEPAVFGPKLEKLCADAGVAVVIAPAPKGCPVSGATKWLSADKALIMLSLRGKTDDKLWFSFFHEAGHLIKHGKKMTFLDIAGEDGLSPQEEQEADTFARDILIPPSDYRDFLAQGLFAQKAIKDFAKDLNIAPGIVLGRLQYEKRVAWSKFSGLKVSFHWNSEEE